MVTYMPFIKIEPGRYLIGTRERKLSIKGSKILVRTGGGFSYFEEYIKHYSRQECIAINNLMNKGDGTVKSALISVLKKHSVDKT